MNFIKIFKKNNTSKDRRVLIENLISLSILQVMGYILPLITLPYLARVIGVESFGELAFAASIIVYFETLTVYGFNYTAVREIAKNREDISAISKIFSNVMFSKILLMFISLLVFTICIYSIPLLYEKRVLLWFTFLYIPGHIMFPDWLFQALEKMKYITLMNLFSKLLFTVLVFVVIKEKSDYIYQPILTALGFFISGVVSLYFIFKKLGVRLILPKLLDITRTIRESSNMFISVFLPNLYTNFSVTLLGFFGGSLATGIFSSGKKFIDLCDQFTQVLSRTFFPFLARKIEKHDQYAIISGSISILMSVVLFLGADLFINIFYTHEFREAAIVIRIMAIAPFFIFLMNTYGTNYLVLQGKENTYKNIVVVCSIGGFLFAWFAISFFSYIGVAITITLVWGIRGFLTWFYASKVKKLTNNK